MTERIEILMTKYCSDKLSNDETYELISWIETGKNKEVFNDYVSLNFTIEQLKSEDQDDSIMWEHIKSSFKTPVRKLNYWKYAVAASIVIVVGLTVYFQKNDNSLIEITTPVIVNNNIEIGTDKAILTTETGEDIVLEEGKQYLANNVSSDGEKIIYRETETNTKSEIEYNYMTVPRGGQFYVELSDDTKVWLNSDSKIKYPKTFIANQDREVELIYGEAYFDVSPSTAHNGDKFKVISQGQTIEVLGTEFNIKAYQDENEIYTTLVEGKVEVSNHVFTKILKPNQQSIVARNSDSIVVNQVDVYNETSWKKGIFSFKGKSFKEISKVLSRWYDVDIVFENKKLEEKKFTGVLSKNQNIEHILLNMKKTNFINAYDINKQLITFK